MALACRKLAEDVKRGDLQLEDIDESALNSKLLTGDLPGTF